MLPASYFCFYWETSPLFYLNLNLGNSISTKPTRQRKRILIQPSRTFTQQAAWKPVFQAAFAVFLTVLQTVEIAVIAVFPRQ